MPNIKIDNTEVSEESLRKVIKEHPELLDIKKEGPLGDDFSMWHYFTILDSALSNSELLGSYKTKNRLKALLKIWEWKVENDGQFGDKEVFDRNIEKWSIHYDCFSKKFTTLGNFLWLNVTEIPYFSSEEIGRKALKELEAEYKIVFNVA